MKFHSTNKKSKNFELEKVLRLGLAPDQGLFMPDTWPKLPSDFFKKIKTKTFQQIALIVAEAFILEMPEKGLKKISDIKNFDFLI